MPGRGAFRDFGYGQVPGPKAKVNKGAKIEDNMDEDGNNVSTYKMTNDPATCLKIREEIATSITEEYPLIGEELVRGILSKYSRGALMTEADITAPQPDGIGPRPQANDIVATAAYKISEDALRKRYIYAQGQYLKDVMSVKGIIKKKFVAQTLLKAIQKKPEFIAAQNEHTSVAEFLNVLEQQIKRTSQPNLNSDQRQDKSRDDLKRNMMELRIKDDCADYLETMQSLMIQHTNFLLMNHDQL